MTTAHRPTFDPARGKEAQRGPAYHQRLLPAHTQLKTRQPGQGGVADAPVHDLRAQLLEAEAAHYSKSNGDKTTPTAQILDAETARRRQLISTTGEGDDAEEDQAAKRRRILEDTRELDADSDGAEDDSSDEDSEDEEDETAELLRELEKIKKERAEQREKEAIQFHSSCTKIVALILRKQEREKAALEQEQREHDIALGNPLLNTPKDFNVKRRWDDDVVFKNQARGTEDKRKKEFVNDLLRSDFHKRFMSRYVR
ncbi:complexed with cef1p [Bachmanniomyces sp. S44760]|nr:complexed with cef1p [Bachmanniomyces sp. S44760]